MSQETQTPNPESNNPSPELTPNPAPQEPTPTNPQPAYNLLQNQAFVESERERIRLQQENEALRNSQTQTQPDFGQANSDYFTKPAETMSRLINEEVTRTIAPIAEKFMQFTRNQEYQNLKNTYRQLPNFNLIESDIDRMMANVEPTAANMNAAISMAVGQLALRGQQFNFSQNQTQPQTTQQITPPNLPPSPPSAPSITNPATRITLTELQKRVARENGMTDEQYIEMLTADSREVITMKRS